MYQYFRIQIPTYELDITVKVKNDRVVSPGAAERLSEFFPDFDAHFYQRPFSEFEDFIINQYRTLGATVEEVFP